MDPTNRSPTRDTHFDLGDSYISPLHQALRGTTAMPTRSGSVPNAHALQNPTMSQTSNPSPQYHIDMETLPPQNQPPSTFASLGFMQSLGNNEHDFLTTPVSDYLNLSSKKQILSMEPPSITSLLQGDPTAVLHAHFSINGVSDLGPIFEDPTLHVSKEVFGSSSNPNFNTHTSNYMHGEEFGSSCKVDPYGKISYGETINFGQSKCSVTSKWNNRYLSVSQEATDGTVQSNMITTAEAKVQRVYTCDLCNATFNSPQAFGGHRSFHSKKKRKNYNS
ncbi:hypothetical protein EJB05_30322, partial [Eragrostis curvula]